MFIIAAKSYNMNNMNAHQYGNGSGSYDTFPQEIIWRHQAEWVEAMLNELVGGDYMSIDKNRKGYILNYKYGGGSNVGRRREGEWGLKQWRNGGKVCNYWKSMVWSHLYTTIRCVYENEIVDFKKNVIQRNKSTWSGLIKKAFWTRRV